MGDWWQVIVTVPAADAELAADVLWQGGAAGVEERVAADGEVVLVAGVDGEGRARAAAAEFGPRRADVRAVDDDGLDAWRPWARAEQAGPWWIVPSWRSTDEIEPAPPPDRVLAIDPGRAFGSGSHPTTRLVLAALERLRPSTGPAHTEPWRALDVGCGSGVLAVALARLGAMVDAIDIDPAAIEATAANAERNGVARSVLATGSPLGDLVARRPAGWDVVAANLLAPTIVELAPHLVTAVAPGGALVASGLLVDRWEPAVATLAPLEVATVEELDGWVAVTLRVPSAP